MITNFSHMKDESIIYDEMLYVEDLLVDGDGTLDYLHAMRGIRSALDELTRSWVRLEKVKVEGGRRTDTGHRINALKGSGKIDPRTEKLMVMIRKTANNAVHYEGDIREMSKQEIYREAKVMYERFYQISYIYLEAKNKAVAAPDQSGAGKQNKK